MSKKTGAKVATFKNLDEDHSRETSFWNEVDDRIDSIESNLPSHVLDVIVNDLRNCKKTNYDLCTDDIKEINNDRFKGRSNLSYSLRELADRYNITINPETGEEISDGVGLNFFGNSIIPGSETIGYELRDNGEYTTTLNG